MKRILLLGSMLALSLALAGCASGGGSAARSEDEPTQLETAASYNLQLGVAYLRQGNLQLSKEKLERARSQNPRDPQIASALGLLYEKIGDERAADRAYRDAVRLAPRSAEVSNNYAIYLCRTNRVDEGVRRFRAAANDRLYRTPEVALTNAGVCLRGAQRLEEAATSFRQALAVRPNHAEAALQLGDLELQRGRTPEARQILDGFLGSFAPNAELLFLGVKIARAQSDRLAEERFARRLRQDFPDTEQARSLASLPPRG